MLQVAWATCDGKKREPWWSGCATARPVRAGAGDHNPVNFPARLVQLGHVASSSSALDCTE